MKKEKHYDQIPDLDKPERGRKGVRIFLWCLCVALTAFSIFAMLITFSMSNTVYTLIMTLCGLGAALLGIFILNKKLIKGKGNRFGRVLSRILLIVAALNIIVFAGELVGIAMGVTN